MSNYSDMEENNIEENLDNSDTKEFDSSSTEGKLSDDKGSSFVREAISWLMVFVIAAVAAFVISKFLIINAVIPTGSMISTINEGDKIIGNRLAYKFSDPKKGDIVLFWSPVKENTIYIKRCIGTPGDTIRIEDGKLFVNGKEKNEPYVKGKPTYPYDGNELYAGTVFEYTLKKDEYFMMGDNRTGSSDSRAWGPVKRDAIIAEGVFRWANKDGISFKTLK